LTEKYKNFENFFSCRSNAEKARGAKKKPAEAGLLVPYGGG